VALQPRVPARVGNTPARFPTLDLPDVYATLWYYLRHQDEVDAYLAERHRQADALRAEVEARWPPDELRERLLARQAV